MATPAPTPLAHPDESLGEYLGRHVELLKRRESDLDGYSGDGPTAAQADNLMAKLRLLIAQSEGSPPSVVWDVFRAAVDMEMTWLFPENDPLGVPIIWALEQLETSTGALLKEHGSVPHEELDRYVSLALVARAAKRQVKLKGNGINWRLVLARFMYWLGRGKSKH